MMKKIWIRVLVLLGVLVLAAAAFTYYQSTREVPEEVPVFQALEASTFPVIYGEFSDEDVAALHGFSKERSLETTETPLIPLSNSMLRLRVILYGNTMEKFSYEIQERNSGEIIGEGEFTDWQNDSDTVDCSLSLGSLISEDQEYRLNLCLELGNGKTVYYYARVCDAGANQASEMLDYVMDFHEDLYVWDQAKTHESVLEIKSGYDQKTLQDVSIYSTISQLAWGNMSVSEVNNSLQMTILELDGSFGSFLLEYEVESGDPLETYLVKEYFSVHSSLGSIYLMDYRRTVTERISSEDSRYSGGYVDFGIVDPDDVELAATEDRSVIVFSVAEEIYSYRPEDGTMVNVFTFRDEDDPVRTAYRRYSTRILDVTEEGDVTFLVYGYMNRGAHEGEIGVSGMTYQVEHQSLVENFFLAYDGSVEELEQSVDQIAYLSEERVAYVLAGDTLYSVDLVNQTATVILEDASAKELAANTENSAIIWKTGDGSSSSVQIMYLNTDTSQTVTAPSGDWIAPVGFIEDDCILMYGHSGDAAEVNGEIIEPAYALIVLNRDGQEEVRYEYDSIYISSVEVRDGQILMERLTGDGTGDFSETTEDILMQSSGSSESESLSLSAYTEDLRMRVYRLKDTGDAKNPNSIHIDTSAGINYDASEALEIETVPAIDGTGLYYAYAEGNFYGTYTTAGTAIADVFDSMGIVLDSSGRAIWRRTGRDSQVSLEPVELLTGTGNDGRNACLTMIGQLRGQSGFMIQAAEESSAMEAMESLFPGEALNLTNAPVRALLYYIYKGSPVLMIDGEENAYLLLGYDQYNVEIYDPSIGEIVRQGQGDFENWLAEGISCIGIVPN